MGGNCNKRGAELKHLGQRVWRGHVIGIFGQRVMGFSRASSMEPSTGLPHQATEPLS